MLDRRLDEYKQENGPINWDEIHKVSQQGRLTCILLLSFIRNREYIYNKRPTFPQQTVPPADASLMTFDIFCVFVGLKFEQW